MHELNKQECRTSHSFLIKNKIKKLIWLSLLAIINFSFIIFFVFNVVSCSSITPKYTKHVTNEFYFNISTNANEKDWAKALSGQLNGKVEQRVTMGRVDVVTETEAIEIDSLGKWHESIGQSLHYSIETHKQPTIALISLTTNDLPKINYIQTICNKLKIRLIILRRK